MAGEPIANLDELISLATSGGTGAREAVNFAKKAIVGGAAAAQYSVGQMKSQWLYEGQPTRPSSFPSTAAVCTNASVGALPFTSSAAGKKKYLLAIQVGICLAVGGVVILYDRLSHQGSLSGIVTSAQTTNLPTAALTRYTDGVGVEPWLEIYQGVGLTTETTVTASYTNDAGTSGQTTSGIRFGGAAGFAVRENIASMPMASGSRGVQAVASVTLAASTGASGNFGVVLVHPLVSLPMTASAPLTQHRSFFTDSDGPLNLGIASDACLAFAILPTAGSSNAGEPMGTLWFAEK